MGIIILNNHKPKERERVSYGILFNGIIANNQRLRIETERENDRKSNIKL